MRRNGHLSRTTTDPAGFHVNVEYPFQSLSPTHRHMSLRGCFLILIRCQFWAALAPPGRRHPHPVLTVRRKHTMESGQVDPGPGYQHFSPTYVPPARESSAKRSTFGGELPWRISESNESLFSEGFEETNRRQQFGFSADTVSGALTTVCYPLLRKQGATR